MVKETADKFVEFIVELNKLIKESSDLESGLSVDNAVKLYSSLKKEVNNSLVEASTNKGHFQSIHPCVQESLLDLCLHFCIQDNNLIAGLPGADKLLAERYNQSWMALRMLIESFARIEINLSKKDFENAKSTEARKHPQAS